MGGELLLEPADFGLLLLVSTRLLIELAPELFQLGLSLLKLPLQLSGPCGQLVFFRLELLRVRTKLLLALRQPSAELFQLVPLTGKLAALFGQFLPL